MRERNNEASKRCRLKRRLKAESLEGQAQMLNMSNKILRQRIVRLERIKKVLKDGVKGINSKESSCQCVETVALIKKTNSECQDVSTLNNRSLIDNSRNCRFVKIQRINCYVYIFQGIFFNNFFPSF